MSNINPGQFTTRPEIDGTFGVVGLHALDRYGGGHGNSGARR